MKGLKQKAVAAEQTSRNAANRLETINRTRFVLPSDFGKTFGNKGEQKPAD